MQICVDVHQVDGGEEEKQLQSFKSEDSNECFIYTSASHYE